VMLCSWRSGVSLIDGPLPGEESAVEAPRIDASTISQ
jgi:hypothetical protein